MLKKILFLTLIIQISGCFIQNTEIKPTIVPTSLQSKTSEPTTQTNIPSPIVSSFTTLPEKYKDYEIIDSQTLCEPISTIKTELKYPYRLAVSKDGNTVYAINGNCKTTSEYPINPIFCTEPDTSNPRIINRTVINKIRKDKTIDIVKLNNEPIMSCSLNGELQVDNDNNLYFSNTNQDIYKLSPDNNLTKLANVRNEKACTDYGVVTYDPATGKYGPCPEKYFSGPKNMYLDEDNLSFIMYLPGSSEPTIIKQMDKNGNIIKIATGRVVDQLFAVFKDNYYTFDYYYFKIQELTKTNEVYTFTDNAILDLIPSFTKEYNDYSGKSYDYIITKMRINSKGEIFVNDLLHHLIWKIIPSNPFSESKVTKFVGSGKAGFKDGKGEVAEFNYPTGMDFDSQDNLYVADTGNNAIRKITPDGIVTTFYVQN